MNDDYKTQSYLEFIDSEKFGNHPIMFYEKPEDGLAIQCRYLHSGLMKGQHVVYFTSETPEFMKDEMMRFGIDADLFQKNGMLHIFQISHKADSGVKDALEKLDEVMKIAQRYTKTSVRMTGRIVKDISANSGQQAELAVEQKLHEIMQHFNGSVLCSYHITKTNGDDEIEWMFNTIHTHSHVVYVPESGNGACFDATFMMK